MDVKWSKFLTILVFAFLASQVRAAAIDYEDTTADTTTATTPSVDFGTALKMYYLAFQRLMPCGYPPLNIPVLAPFTLDHYSFNLTNGYYSTAGDVSNVMVTGLNNFKFLGFAYNSTNNRTTFDLIFPEIQLLGESKFIAMAYLAGFRTQMADSGLLNIKVIDFRMVGELTLSPAAQNPGSLQVSNFDLHFYIADALFNNWNNLWDISANNFVNKWAREFSLMWAEQIQVQVDEIYAQLLLPNINGKLNGVSMTDLIDFLMQQSMEFNSADCTLE